MRIERTGEVKPLTPRIIRFLTGELGAVAIDDVVSHQDRRIDYECLRGLLAIELKTLEGSPAERTNNFADTLRDRSDFPLFHGEMNLEAAFRNMEGANTLRRAAIQRVGRPIVTHLKKANDQLAAHDRTFPRRNRLRVMLLINEDHAEYDPDSVGWIIHEALGQEAEGRLRYEHVDAVIYMTERHATDIDGAVAMPTLLVLGAAVEEQVWKERVLDWFVARWAAWSGQPLLENTVSAPFVAMEHVPDQMPKHEAWRLAYRRNPYLRSLSNDTLRDAFDEVLVLVTIMGVKGSPMQLAPDAIAAMFERFTHLQVEINDRGLSMTAFAYEPERELSAARRLKLPEPIVQWLSHLPKGS